MESIRNVVVHLLIVAGCSWVVTGQVNPTTLDLAAGDRPGKINLERLLMDDPRGIQESPFQLRLHNFFSSAKITDFFLEPNTYGTCALPMRVGFKCIELTNAQAGYMMNPPPCNWDRFPYFRPLNHRTSPLYVYWDHQDNKYWIRVPDPERIYGPFYGEPVERIRNALLRYKDRTSLAGVEVKFLAERWEFPNEKDAMVNRTSGDYDFVGGRMSGRQIEAMRLNSAYVRFRITNNGDRPVFLQYRRAEPDVVHLGRFADDTSWRRQLGMDIDTAEFYDGQDLSFEMLPAGGSLEFDLRSGCQKPLACVARFYVNESRDFWDPVQIDVPYPGTSKRTFSRKNRPPRPPQ